MRREEELRGEAEAFDQRIEDRINAGFVPDLRQATKCPYFYKSFWRDPYFVKLYEVAMIETLLDMLRRHAGEKLSILDVGCGAGYVALEFARAGHRVFGIDISEKSIEVAKRYRDLNPYKEHFGSLEYAVMTIEQVRGNFDCILFSGFLHHLREPEEAIRKGLELLSPNGLVLSYEPCHDEWGMQDAAQVALIRGLLALTGYWYQSPFGTESNIRAMNIETYIRDVYTEYVTERDKDEQRGQSPNDNSSSGQQILRALRKCLRELEYRPGFAFIYRLLGGLRGPDRVVYSIADFLATYEKHAVESGYLKPNAFYFLGQKPSEANLAT